MKILMVGKTGVFDTLAVASGYLGQREIYNSPYFADLTLENSKNIVNVGTDENDNKLFVVGFNVPKVIPIINQELAILSNINENERLRVIPISVNGENITWVLCKLSNLPLIGTLFVKWAKNRTLNRLPYLREMGRNIYSESNINIKDKPDSVFAAKPIRNGDKK